MKIKELKNRDDVIEAIAREIMDNDAECPPFEVDIYLYIDDDGNGRVETFTNPGGNSWLNDDHITVCSMGPHTCKPYEEAEFTAEDMLEIAGMSREEAILAVVANRPEKCDDWDIHRYIEANYEEAIALEHIWGGEAYFAALEKYTDGDEAFLAELACEVAEMLASIGRSREEVILDIAAGDPEDFDFEIRRYIGEEYADAVENTFYDCVSMGDYLERAERELKWLEDE